jgi:hypothetical protein
MARNMMTIDNNAICTLFDTRAGRMIGTGFAFLHPQWIATAAHVVIKDGLPREGLEVRFHGKGPTQIVTEYFRDRYVSPDDRKVDGIRYRSAQRPGGVCVVLFFDNKGCADDTDAPAENVGLVLDLRSIRRRRLNW